MTEAERRRAEDMAQKINGKPGDLIEISRGSYQHWAVYIGENEVVHFTTEGGQWYESLESLSSSDGNEFHQSLINVVGQKQVNKLLDVMNQTLGMDDISATFNNSLKVLISKTGEVKREKLAHVVGNGYYLVNNLLDQEYKARDPSIIVKEACEMVDREPKYDLVTYNSQHFATEMRYGKAAFRQFNGKPGDLIEINRGPYKQWAIYIGDNEMVMLVKDGGRSHGSSAISSSSTGKVKREKLANVVGNDRCQVNNLLDEEYQPRDPSIIVKEACAIVGRELQYNVVTYNCEHFATEMRYGVAVSLQMKKPSWIASVAGAAVALVTGGSGVALGVAAVGAFVVCAALIRSRSSS